MFVIGIIAGTSIYLSPDGTSRHVYVLTNQPNANNTQHNSSKGNVSNLLQNNILKYKLITTPGDKKKFSKTDFVKRGYVQIFNKKINISENGRHSLISRKEHKDNNLYNNYFLLQMIFVLIPLIVKCFEYFAKSYPGTWNKLFWNKTYKLLTSLGSFKQYKDVEVVTNITNNKKKLKFNNRNKLVGDVNMISLHKC